MTAIKKYFLLLLAVTIASLGFGQSSESGIDQTLHESGKIYIVVAVLSVVLIGIIFFLIKTELKIKKLEDEIRN